jgi:hypothetical protein
VATITGTAIARHELAGVMLNGLTDVIETAATAVTAKLDSIITTLEKHATALSEIEEIEVGCQYDDNGDAIPGSGTTFRLFTLFQQPGPALTGWRRREAWRLLKRLKKEAGQVMKEGNDLFDTAIEIAGSDDGIMLLGLAFGPVGTAYDKSKVREYGELIDEALHTEHIVGVVLRFFSLNASSILRSSRSFLASLPQMGLLFGDRMRRGVATGSATGSVPNGGGVPADSLAGVD